MDIKAEFRAFLNEANELLNAEEKKILSTFKKHLKEKAKYSQEGVIEGLPITQNGKPGLAIFYWIGGTTNTSGFDKSFETDILNRETKLPTRPKFEKGTKKKRPGASSFDQVKLFTVDVTVVYLKNSTNFENILEILKKSGIKAELNDNKIVGEYETSSEQKEIQSIASKFKNVNVEFGKIYLDVDNKHSESVFTITIK